MPSSFFFMLGFVVATVIAQEQTSENVTVPGLHSSIITTNPMSTTISSVTPTINTSNSDAEINVSTESSTAEPFGTTLPSGQSATEATRATMLQTTPAPGSSATKALSPTTKATLQKSSTPSPQRDSSDKTGIIILVVLILVAVVFLIACYVTQKRRRRYSVDSSRQDEVNIPLSTVEPVDTAPQNGLKTFESTETTEKKPEEPEAKPEATDEAKPEKQEEQKAETDKSVADPSTESATPTPAPAPDSSEDKPKADVPEQSPPAPVESTVEVKTDDEAAVSNKTSVESLKETNENNSNNAGFIQTRSVLQQGHMEKFQDTSPRGLEFDTCGVKDLLQKECERMPLLVVG